MKSRKGFTLVELMVVILIVAILAAVAIPILRGRIDAAKWSEGKAMMGSIATAIRAYCAEKGSVAVTLTTADIIAATGLGFASGDLTGTYFADGDFGADASYDPANGAAALTFTVTCTAGSGGPTNAAPTYPASYTLNQAGDFTAGS